MKKITSLGVLLLAAFAFTIPSGSEKDAAWLGEKLFSEPILSSDSSVSCASCHKPGFAFADTSAFSTGVKGIAGERNTPSAMNVKHRLSFFWDGRAGSLEEQALIPIENPLEMNLPVDEAVSRLKEHPVYRQDFIDVFGSEPSPELLGRAIAAFEMTLETGSTPFDRWMQDEPGGMSEAAIRGRDIFMNKGKCFDCHSGSDFTNDEFRNIGLYDGITYTDPGRFTVTGDSTDLGRFRVPGLRNIAVTAPYMHNGMFRTLEEVVSYYNDPYKTVAGPLNIDSLMILPLGLTRQEEADLVEFMKALTDDRYSEELNQKH